MIKIEFTMDMQKIAKEYGGHKEVNEAFNFNFQLNEI